MKIKKTALAIASTLTMAATAIAPQVNADVGIDDIVGDQATTADIVSYGLGPRGQRYSPLSTINKDNIKNLFPVWSFSFGGEKQRGQESQPLIKDCLLYTSPSPRDATLSRMPSSA